MNLISLTRKKGDRWIINRNYKLPNDIDTNSHLYLCIRINGFYSNNIKMEAVNFVIFDLDNETVKYNKKSYYDIDYFLNIYHKENREYKLKSLIK